MLSEKNFSREFSTTPISFVSMLLLSEFQVGSSSSDALLGSNISLCMHS